MKKNNFSIVFILLLFLSFSVFALNDTNSFALQDSKILNPSNTYSELTSWNWKPVELVSSESTSVSDKPSAAVDKEGNVHVVWVDQTDYSSSGIDQDLFYKKWNVKKHSWSNTEVLTPESSLDSIEPDIAIDSAGNVHVVWRDGHDYTGTSSPTYDIFYKKWNVYLKNWETTQYISVDSTDFSISPVVAVDTLGNVHVAWKEYTSKQDIHHRRWNNITQSWLPTEIVSVESSAEAQQPTMKIDLWNNLHIAYLDNTDIFSSGTDFDLYYKKWDFTTSSWSALELVSTESTALSYNPIIDVDSLGNAHLAWSDHTEYDGSGVDTDIFYKYRNLQTDTWTVSEIISWTSSASSFNPQLAVDSNNVAHIVWDDNTDIGNIGTDDDIFYRKVGSDLIASVEVISSTSNSTSERADICIDDSGYIHIVWKDESKIVNAGSDSDILYRCYNGPINSPILSPIVPNPTESDVINLDWTEVSGATTYHIYKSSSFITDLESLTPLSSSFTDDLTDNLPSDGYYYYAIVADNGIYNSTISNCEYVLYQVPHVREFTITASLILGTIVILFLVFRKRRRK